MFTDRREYNVERLPHDQVAELFGHTGVAGFPSTPTFLFVVLDFYGLHYGAVYTTACERRATVRHMIRCTTHHAEQQQQPEQPPVRDASQRSVVDPFCFTKKTVVKYITLRRSQGVLEMHAERLEDRANEREELWRAIETLRLAEPSDVTGFTEIDRAHLTFGGGMPVVRRECSIDMDG